MPKQAVRILIAAIVVASALGGTAAADQQSHQGTKTTTPAAPPATPNTVHGTAKLAPVSRDVCEKHPNLKQCS